MAYLTAFQYVLSVSYLRYLGFLAIAFFVLNGYLFDKEDGVHGLCFGVWISLYFFNVCILSVDQNEVLRITPHIRKRFAAVMLPFLVLPILLYFFSPHRYNILLILIAVFWLVADLISSRVSCKKRWLVESFRAAPIVFGPSVDAELSPYAWGLCATVLACSLIWIYRKPQPWEAGFYNDIVIRQISSGSTMDAFWRARWIRTPHSLGLYLSSFSIAVFVAFQLFLWGIIGVSSDRWGGFNPFIFSYVYVLVVSVFSAGMVQQQQSTFAWYSLRPGKGALSDVQSHLVFGVASKTFLCIAIALISMLIFQHEVSDQMPAEGVASWQSILAYAVLIWLLSNGLFWFFATFDAHGALRFVITLSLLGVAAVVSSIVNVQLLYTGSFDIPLIGVLMSLIFMGAVSGIRQFGRVNWA